MRIPNHLILSVGSICHDQLMETVPFKTMGEGKMPTGNIVIQVQGISLPPSIPSEHLG